MPKHPTRGLIRALSTLLKRARACGMSALALYLAKPVDEFSMLTTADQQALATVLRRGDVLLSAGSTRCAELVKRLTQSRWSHVSMYVGALEDASDPRCVVEAHIADGVRAIRISELDARRICVLRPVGLDETDRGRACRNRSCATSAANHDFAPRRCARMRSSTPALELLRRLVERRLRSDSRRYDGSP